MRVLGVNGYLASSGRFPDSLWIHRKCRDQMMALKLTQSRKEEDVKHARGHHLQCVLGQTPALEVLAGHFFAVPPLLADFRICLAALDPGIQTVRPHQQAVWVSARRDTLSLTYLGQEKRKRCSQKQFQSLCIWKEYFSWWRARKTRYLCICFLSSPFIPFTSFERTNS